jgi:hypothetical protein
VPALQSARSRISLAVVPAILCPLGLWAFQAAQQPPAAAPPAAQPGRGAPSPTQQATNDDRQKMLDLLGIKTLRPWKNGTNPQDPTFANYDESKANPYPKLPDPLVMKNGKKVTSAAMWTKQRRPEIVEDFDREVYGRTPKNLPKVTWTVTSTANGTMGGVPTVTKYLTGHVDNSAYPKIEVNILVNLTTPANASGPVPVVMQFGSAGPPGAGGRGLGMMGGAAGRGPAAPGAAAPGAAAPGAPGAAAPGAPAAAGGRAMPAMGGAGRGPAGPSWQQQVIEKGWGYATIAPNSIQADNGAGLREGIIGLCNKGEYRKPDDWGALKAWGWGASRALDYFETDKAVDAKHVALEGHSRYGKATIVALAYDQRFWTAYVSSSGEGGAKLHRRNWGEIIENVANTSEYHWMAGNFLKYAGPLTWDDLPVDSHELVAMCAPRPVFISAGKGGYDAEPGGDSWVDAKGMFLAGVGAGPVYKLFGKKPMSSSEFPPIETGVMDGDVAFRQHASGHTDGPNWPVFLSFAERYVKAPAKKK